MKTAKRVYKKKVHKKEHNADLHALALAMIAIIACMVSLCGASWAWFTASTATGTSAIRSATFSIDGVTLKNSSGTQTQITQDGNGKYTTAPIEPGNYNLEFKAAGGTNTTANGYCVITVTAEGETAGTPYYTEKINGDSFSLTLEIGKKVIVSIEPRWGDIPEPTNLLSSSGAINIAGAATESKPTAQNITPKPQMATPPTAQAEQAEPENDKTESEPDKANSSAY